MTAKTIPILPSRDFDETARFYAPLGFRETGRWAGEYLTIARDDGIELHFWSKPNLVPAKNDVACYIRFDRAAEARTLHDAWAPRVPNGGHLHPPAATDYGLLEFALGDPHGNLLRIGGSL
jgi:catechol 2,3-dioxygenase-like lactoylglutathione lyase family enzyme